MMLGCKGLMGSQFKKKQLTNVLYSLVNSIAFGVSIALV